MPRAHVMHATARRGSLLRDSMMSAKAGPRNATVCKVLRTRVTLQPDLISLSASRPAHNDNQHAAPGLCQGDTTELLASEHETRCTARELGSTHY